MEKIDINAKLSTIDTAVFNESITKMLYKLWMDSGAKFDKELFDHTCKSLSYSLHNYHKSLLFAEIKSIFRGISLGQYNVSRISAKSFLGALNEYLEAKRKRTVYDNDLNHSIERSKESSYIASSGLPVGSAIIFKMEQREAGNAQYENTSLKEIAEMLKAGKLKLTKNYTKK